MSLKNNESISNRRGDLQTRECTLSAAQHRVENFKICYFLISKILKKKIQTKSYSTTEKYPDLLNRAENCNS